MSALALPSVIAPVQASAPQGSSGAADATGFQSLLATCIDKETAAVETEEAAPAAAKDASDAAAPAIILVAPVPIAPPVAAPAMEPVVAGAEAPAPTAVPAAGPAPEIDPTDLRQPSVDQPPVAPAAEATPGLDPSILQQAGDDRSSDAPRAAATPAIDPPMPHKAKGDPVPAPASTQAVETPKDVDPSVPQQIRTDQPSVVAAPIQSPPVIEPRILRQTGSTKPEAAASGAEPGAAAGTRAAPEPGPVAADAPAPELPASPAAATTGKKAAADAPNVVAPPSSQPAPPPLRALAERTSRPLDPPSGKISEDTASASGPTYAGLSVAAPSASPASQTAPDRIGGPTEAATKAAGEGPGAEAPSIDAAPASETTSGSASTTVPARETSLSGLSRATIDATAQIAAQILRKLEGRSTRFEMALTPDDLGRVDIKLDIDSEGRLAARLAFDNPLAATDMRGRVDELRRELEDAGFHLAEDAFEFAERDSGSSSFDRGQDARHGQNRAFAAAARLNDEIDVAQPPRWMALSLSPSGVDLKV
ncbi:flagellar hook-length control protein FliK [Brevundimonas sp.]|uniref:flagellar hook-length control protein FliK n=1 Tax=Brevundimonas sp. TaxID=1871086 RepID=UPI002FC755BD